ncbi:hypothetical protein P152DRAFT_459044 [Eremomyces bilateralis CBS 781.70]|uniref:Mitochondrial fission process protein 1 n=1 Tax=Eremomyces bilateralis CBS 781.70 TaxID=1392243 RepID=A0A6G1G2D4_9PEZI|nr:uncharacterized protein P152DRAFT_459044 [Eremomyces bilateralis CBS 781.70]KAF1812086.1 hypothetical protein P152DRAFT_459044 [Eremomyces bilateralis CBS 781.70]
MKRNSGEPSTRASACPIFPQSYPILTKPPPSAPESTDSSVRYAAYATRIRTILLSAQRYVAYTSDIGESFRPVAHPHLVRGAYAISWLYIGGDVAHEGYKAYLRNMKIRHPERYFHADGSVKEEGREGKGEEVRKVVAGSGGLVAGKISAIEDYRAVMAERAVFQSLASMGLPAFTIHSIVRYSGRAMKDMKNKTLRTWGPIGVSEAAWRRYTQYSDLLMMWLDSSVWRRCRSCRSCSTSRWRRRWGGRSIRRSRRLEGRKR